MPHITVCICTYKRPSLLGRALEEINRLETAGQFSYSVVVADNDRFESAKQVVKDFLHSSQLEVIYCVEPEQNIALVRNLAVRNAKGEYIAFLDDDEFPQPDWLLKMFEFCRNRDVAGALGPVTPYFENEPPSWLLKGKFCERPTHASGTVLNWAQTTTANTFFRSEILNDINEPFNPAFSTGGEDNDFFRRMMAMGHVFIWCNEAVLFEILPPQRWTRSYLLKRAWLRGQSQRQVCNWRSVVRSLVAVPFYALVIPVTWVMGPHIFMNYMIRMCDHCGKLCALLGYKPLGDQYLPTCLEA